LTGQPITGQLIAGEPVQPAKPGTWTPEPGAAPLGRMVAAQAAQEARQLLRNGEQLMLMLIIPLLLLAAFSLEPLIDFGGGYTRIDFLAPGVIALAVMSTAFTSQAIATGFERRYGVLKRLGATPLSRTGLITAKTATVIGVELVQAAIILLVATALGWAPDARWSAVVTVPLLVLLGTAAFSGFALLLAGTLRAEATLAAANLIYVVLLGIGGVVFPLTKFPRGARPLLELLPTGALSTGLRDVLANAAVFPARDVVTLAVWAVAGTVLAARFFRWE
jgi:ABC-2 type transport system permease protein